MNLVGVRLIGSITPRYAPEGWEQLADNPSMLAIVFATGATAVAVALWYAWRERSVLKPGRWKALAVIRLLALASIALSLAGWQRRPTTEQIDPSRVVMLVDASTSMLLPDTDASGSSRAERASVVAEQIDNMLGDEHLVERARFGEAVAYTDQADIRLFAPTASSTRLGDALQQVLADYQSTPLAGVILLSDGRSNDGINPLTAAKLAAERGLPIHTLGLGPLHEPKSLKITRLAAPFQAYSGDTIAASVVVRPGGGLREGRELIVKVREEDAPEDEGREVSRSRLLFNPDLQDPSLGFDIEFDAPPAGKYVLEATLTDPRAKGGPVKVPFESVDRKTQVLLIAGGPSRDYRFLRDQLRRDKSFEVDVLLQSSLGSISQDAREILDSFPESPDLLDSYDAVVAFDPDWAALGEDSQKNLLEWVALRGGGLFLIPGVAHAFSIGGEGFPRPIAQLAPVEVGGDPLGALAWDARVDQPRPIKLTSSGERVGFLQLEKRNNEGDFWRDFEGFYAAPPKVTPKLGATIFATLGDEETPLIVEQFYGAGRVMYLATGETWRIRQIDQALFTEMHTKLLRRISAGRLLGAAARGTLHFDQARYEVGDSMKLRLILRENKPRIGDSVEDLPKVGWRSPRGDNLSIPMEHAPSGHGTYFLSRIAESEGSYDATVAIDGGDLILRASTEVVLPGRESLASTRDAQMLDALAENDFRKVLR